MTDLHFQTAIKLAELIRRQETSSLELTDHFIARIEKHDGDINAVPVRIFERARDDARAADAAIARGDSNLGPLHGVPMTIKESYVIEGTPATWGHEDQRNNIGRADGLAVSRFRAAGAHFLGKTNVPVDLADFQSYNPVYGTTGNPFDTDRTPGGSSGGSAAALAAGFSALEAGSDIGGSIRNPAHFCGVFGHKPSSGVVPLSGHELIEGVPDADLSVCGPLARSAEDLRVALSIMAGPTPREATAWRLELPASDRHNLKDFRVALWPTDDAAPVSQETQDRVYQIGEILRTAGATVSDSARPAFAVPRAHSTYMSLLQAVMSSAQPADRVPGMQAFADTFDPSDQSGNAVSARASVMLHRDWIRHDFRREKLRRAWDEFFTDWDILICPQMARHAFRHDHGPFAERTIMVDDVEQSYFQQIFWSGLITNSYLPSTVFPTGPGTAGLPIGLQAVSGIYQDYRSIEFAQLITEQIGGFTPPPGL
jgi:amidase